MNIDPPDSIVLSGGFIMELCFDVKRAEMVIGKVRVEKQGLYCKIKCKCVLDTSEVCKLHLSCFGADRNLGVLIPDGAYYVLETSIASKYVDLENPVFSITGLQTKNNGVFLPIDKNTPFPYIHRLESAKFLIQDGRAGVWLPDEQP